MKCEPLQAFFIPRFGFVQFESYFTFYFPLPSQVHAIVSKMILKQHITAAWDQPQQCICVEQNSVTKLQFLASQMSDKCTQLVDYNEKRQAEKEERQGNRQDGQYDRHNYNGRQRKKWDQHKVGIQKSRQTERKSHNAFERRTWKR